MEYCDEEVGRAHITTPSYDELKEFVCDAMLEFSSMRDFDALHFFVCQRCLMKIYLTLNAEDELKFFTLLFDLNYADITWRCLKDENLLDTTAPGFSSSLIRDVLNLLVDGSYSSKEFALILAEKDAVKTFTDFLISHKNAQNSQSNWIISEVVTILCVIARRKEAKKIFSVNKTYDVIKKMEFKEGVTSMVATILLVLIEDDSTTDTEAKTTAVQLLPLYPELKEYLSNDDPDEQIFTTQCLRGLCRNKEGSEKIIIDDELNYILTDLINSHNEDLSANVHSILWTAGRTTGILPSKTDIVLSDEFPKRFEIKPTPLGQGGFGSVHFVVDIDQPDDERFVAKKTIADPKNQKKWTESLQSEASILIKLKHKNIVKFHGYQRKENDIILFLST